MPALRDILTGLAIVLIVVLTAALVGPYLVDWNGQRAFLEARLSHALGQKVTIGGQIDLKLLPTPYLVVDQTVIGSDEGQIRIGVRHLDLELSMTPLLHGEFDITEAQLREPTLRITLQSGHSLPAVGDVPAFDANVRFDRIVIKDGTIAISDADSGQSWILDHLDVVADASSLTGPFKGSGTAGSSDKQTKFRFATTATQASETHAHLTIDETPLHAGIDLDGLLQFVMSAPEKVEPSFDGTMVLSGHLGDSDDDGLAYSLNGPVKIDVNDAKLDSGSLRLGSDDAGLSLDAGGSFHFGEQRKLTLDLSAKQLDIDRLSGDDRQTEKHVARFLSFATFHDLASRSSTDLTLKVDAATYGGEALNDVDLHFTEGGKGHETFAFKSSGPGASHVTMDGTSVTGGKDFIGSFALGADDVPQTLKWLRTIGSPVQLSENVPFTAAQAKGTFETSPSGVTTHDVALTLDRSDLNGTLRFIYGSGGKADQLVADMRAKILDLNALPSLDSIASASGAVDFRLSLDATALKVSQVGEGNLAGGRLRFDISRTGQSMRLENFRADDIGGATIVGQGDIDASSAHLAASIDAKKLNDAANVLERLVPGRFTHALTQRAPSLVPANVKVDAAFSRAPQGSFQPTSVSISGKLASTTIDAAITPEPADPKTYSVKATANAPQGHALLSQLGLQALPLDLLGPSHITLNAQGSFEQSLQTHVEGSFGNTSFSSEGHLKLFGTSTGGSGTLTIKSPDISPLLQSAALAFPDLLGRISVDLTAGAAISGTGVAFSDIKGSIGGEPVTGTLKWEGQSEHAALSGSLDVDHLSFASLVGLSLGPLQAPANDNIFSNAPFTAGLIDPPRSALKLRTKALDLGLGFVATQAGFELNVSPNILQLKKLTADFRDGHISANLTLRRDGPMATVEGNIAANGVNLAAPSARGQLTGHLDLAGGGRTSAALVSSLAGGGEATIQDLRVDRADPLALRHIFDAIERDDLAVDEESVVRAYDGAAQAPLAAGDRRFRLGLASGALRLDGLDAAAQTGAVTSDIDGTLGLTSPGLQTTTTETLHTLPKDWTGAPPSIVVTWSGPFNAPTRHVDVSNLINAAASRALARETARLEAYEFDIRERSFFNARLSSEHRREADQLKAADDARKAEEARIAAKKAAEEKAKQDDAGRPERAGEPPTAPNPDDRSGQPPPSSADPSSAGRY